LPDYTPLRPPSSHGSIESQVHRDSTGLTPHHHLAVGLANIPEKIRGFGHVKARHLVAAKADEAALLLQFRADSPSLLSAAE
jgi:indolepyruvate ferredoxin oxidoreductase